MHIGALNGLIDGMEELGGKRSSPKKESDGMAKW